MLQANNKWDLLYEQVTKHGLSVNYLVGGFDYIIEQKNQVLLFQMMCHSSEFIVFYDSCEQFNGVCRKLWCKSLGQTLNYFRKKAVE